MAKVQLADIMDAGVGPAVWAKYIIERTAELTKFKDSGIIGTDEIFDALAQGGGRTVQLPFWKDLTGTRQILSDAAPLTPKKMTSGKDVAMIHNDGDAFSVNILAELLSAADPVGAISELIGGHWARNDEAMLISSLKGVFAAFDAVAGDPNLLKIGVTSGSPTSATTLNGTTFIDALQKLGDRAEGLVAIAMHSATEAALKKLDLIDFIPDSEGKAMIATFQGRRVIVDDTMFVSADSTKVYTSVLFGPGAIGKGNASLNEPLEGGFGTKGLELARDPLGSDTHLINRRRYILHPRGVKFDPDGGGALAGVGPTNAELETAAKWSMVYEAKNIRLVGIQHNN